MSAFSVLAAGAIATTRGALGTYPTQVVAGSTWLFDSPVFLDDTGAPVDFSAAGIACTCRVIDSTGAVVATPVFTGAADGTFSLAVDESVTASIAAGRYSWGCQIGDGVDTVTFWAPQQSPFLVQSAA